MGGFAVTAPVSVLYSAPVPAAPAPEFYPRWPSPSDMRSCPAAPPDIRHILFVSPPAARRTVRKAVRIRAYYYRIIAALIRTRFSKMALYVLGGSYYRTNCQLVRIRTH